MLTKDIAEEAGKLAAPNRRDKWRDDPASSDGDSARGNPHETDDDFSTDADVGDVEELAAAEMREEMQAGPGPSEMRPEKPGDDNRPPLDGYDDLSVAAIREGIRNLSADELRPVADYEGRHRNRKTLLAFISRQIERNESEA